MVRLVQLTGRPAGGVVWRAEIPLANTSRCPSLSNLPPPVAGDSLEVGEPASAE